MRVNSKDTILKTLPVVVSVMACGVSSAAMVETMYSFMGVPSIGLRVSEFAFSNGRGLPPTLSSCRAYLPSLRIGAVLPSSRVGARLFFS